MSVGETLLMVLGVTVIVTAVPFIVVIVGLFIAEIMANILWWIEDKFF